MKQRKYTIFHRFAIVIFTLIAFLGFVFIIITYLAVTNYHQATTQLLNKDVAQHIAEFTKALTPDGLNKSQADSVFQNAMVMNPNAEVYFLDSSGRVIYFEATEEEIKERNVPLKDVLRYLEKEGKEYIKGTDPKDPSTRKIFSAAVVHTQNKSVGYIYVVLGSEKSAGIMGLLFGSHVITLAIKGFIIVILLSLIFSLWYLKRIRKNFYQIVEVLERFESGDYTARFGAKKVHDLEIVPQAFNKMADLLSSSIDKLTRSEQERKDFIATISHDLRTPLSIARGYVETLILKKEKGNITAEEQEEYCQLILGKILQIEKMAKQLFELSKMEAVEFVARKEPFVLSEIVQEAVNTFQVVAKEKNISLDCIQCLYHVWVEADVSMMERVVQNLVDNAVKNTPGGGWIKAGITVEGNDLVFTIENTGPPLTDDLLQWINDLKDGGFTNYKTSLKSGLGLVIVQKILHLHGASLKAHVTSGTNIFTFRLPVLTIPS